MELKPRAAVRHDLTPVASTASETYGPSDRARSLIDLGDAKSDDTCYTEQTTPLHDAALTVLELRNPKKPKRKKNHARYWHWYTLLVLAIPSVPSLATAA